MYFATQAKSVITVDNYTDLLWWGRAYLYRKPVFANLVRRIVVKKPLTESQIKRLPKYISKKLCRETNDFVTFAWQLYLLPDDRPSLCGGSE